MKKNQTIFLLWVFMVFLWNFGFPNARPIYDVLIAISLSLFSTFLSKQY